MIIKSAFFLLSITLIHFAYGAEQTCIDIEDLEARAERVSTQSSMVASAASSTEMARITGLNTERVSRVREALGADYERNIYDVISYRSFFRKAANITEALGNGLLYCGSGLSTVASVIQLTGASETASNIILFTSTALLGAHITLIGIAKCAAREAGEREDQLEDLAGNVGFRVIPMTTTVTDDAV